MEFRKSSLKLLFRCDSLCKSRISESKSFGVRSRLFAGDYRSSRRGNFVKFDCASCPRVNP